MPDDADPAEAAATTDNATAAEAAAMTDTNAREARR